MSSNSTSPIENKVSNYSCLATTGKVLLITSLALVALLLISAGLSNLVPNPFSIPIHIPPLEAGIFIGSGGVLLSLNTLYILYKLLRCLSSSPSLPNNYTPAEIEKLLSQEEKTDVEEKEISSENSLNPPSLSLTYAMRCFKNYTPELAAKYSRETTLAAFLQSCERTYPEAGIAKAKIQELVHVQQILESIDGDVNEILSLYKQWLENEEATHSFFFFAKLDREESQEHILIELKKEEALSVEEIQSYLSLLQQHMTQKTPLPDHPLIAAALAQREPLIHLFHRFVKVAETEHFKICKRLYQIALLQRVLSEYPEWKQDADFRKWVASSILYFKRRNHIASSPRFFTKRVASSFSHPCNARERISHSSEAC